VHHTSSRSDNVELAPVRVFRARLCVARRKSCVVFLRTVPGAYCTPPHVITPGILVLEQPIAVGFFFRYPCRRVTTRRASHQRYSGFGADCFVCFVSCNTSFCRSIRNRSGTTAGSSGRTTACSTCRSAPAAGRTSPVSWPSLDALTPTNSNPAMPDLDPLVAVFSTDVVQRTTMPLRQGSMNTFESLGYCPDRSRYRAAWGTGISVEGTGVSEPLFCLSPTCFSPPKARATKVRGDYSYVSPPLFS